MMIVIARFTVDNMALNKTASQVSTYRIGTVYTVANWAVDGRYDTGSCTLYDKHPWWAVDLGEAYNVLNVTVTNSNNPIHRKYH